MTKGTQTIICLVLFMMAASGCRKPFEPAVFSQGQNYLVVDGFINMSAAGITTINLSRTRDINDTAVAAAESGAQVSIETIGSGPSYTLAEQGHSGVYTSVPLTLPYNQQYRIKIRDAGGDQFQSDPLTAMATPAIDSVSWKQDVPGLTIYVNTHDPANATRYYRWQWLQTWEYHSQLETVWGEKNGRAYVRGPNDQVHICYSNTPSTAILIGSSAALKQDIIDHAPIAFFAQNDSTLAYRSSFLVQQYALSPAAYEYWQIIRKNSEEKGTLFDLQPAQLEGNLHSITHPPEIVVGYLMATTVREQRIFIGNADLQGWQGFQGSYNCSQVKIPVNQADFLIIDYADTSYAPYYYITSGPLVMAKNHCLDCTRSGGTTTKPAYW